MNKKQEIIRWFDQGREIQSGIALYMKHGNNQNIIRRLNVVKDRKILREILDNELRVVAGLPVLPERYPKRRQKNNKPLALDTLKKTQKKENIPTAVPEILAPIYLKKKEHYVLARNLHARICGSNDQEERRQMAIDLLDAWDKINECWRKIDYYNMHRRLPSPEMVIPTPDIKADTTDPLALERRRRTLKTYISRGKQDPERNQQNLIDWQKEISAIEKLLQ